MRIVVITRSILYFPEYTSSGWYLNNFREWTNRNKPRKLKISEVKVTSLLLNAVNVISKDKNVLHGIKHYLKSLIHKGKKNSETQGVDIENRQKYNIRVCIHIYSL